eukprot:TRINITY_DN5730_c0_g1_i1.p1 TRINITY_DN5730_c0_g1~~TRINITY_DN5730_c0_g1_i1.p1  ORF type:complete len:414 (+),score=22.08 TRINITY_DN5730_c0_g1_i1:49-1290(+)
MERRESRQPKSRAEMTAHLSNIINKMKQSKEDAKQKFAHLPVPITKMINTHIDEEADKYSNILHNIIEEKRIRLVVYGNSLCGKTSIIASLAGVDMKDYKPTAKPNWIVIPDSNLEVLDLRGVVFNRTKSKEIIQEAENCVRAKRPDCLLMVFSAEDVTNWDTESHTELRKVIQEASNPGVYLFKERPQLPELYVVNKVDSCRGPTQYRKDDDESFDEWKSRMGKLYTDVEDYYFGMLKEIFPFVRKDRLLLTSCRKPTRAFGIERLREALMSETLVLPYVFRNNFIKNYQNVRKDLAAKLIASCSSICVAVSLLPIADIFLTTVVIDYMLSILVLFRSDDSKLESFEKVFQNVTTANNVTRTALLITAFGLEATGILAPVGIALGMAVSGTSCAAIGAAAYRYLTDSEDLVF